MLEGRFAMSDGNLTEPDTIKLIISTFVNFFKSKFGEIFLKKLHISASERIWAVLF